MKLTVSIIKPLVKRKLATAVLVMASLAAFATLGDGNKKKVNNPTPFNVKNFSLRSGYNYKSNNLLTQEKKCYIKLNSTITYQKGNATYVLPLKKKVIFDKIKFAPTQTRF